ncbi:MAG: hypothetical protein RLZZ28_2576 [Bacteroidota bacterium]
MPKRLPNITDRAFPSIVKPLDNKTILKSKKVRIKVVSKKRIQRELKKIFNSFILFDWEFYSNELEYE